MKLLKIVLIVLVSAFAAQAAELHMYAGAGLRAPVEVIIADYEKETGNKVTVEYAGMGQLLTRFTTTNTGDVFLSGSEFYVNEIAKAGKVLSSHKLVYHTAVMVVRKDKANGINTFADLAKSNLKIAAGDPQAIALGQSAETMMDKSGYGEELRKKVTVRGTTIKQVLLYITNGDVDAAVIGRSDAVANADKFVILPTPEGTPQEVSVVAALSTSKNQKIAQELADYFTRPESIKAFTDLGFLPVNQ